MRKHHCRSERAQALVLFLIVLAVIAGGAWMLLSSRTAREDDAKRFARETAERLLLQRDARFLNERLAPRAQVLFPPSWRERFFGWVHDVGPLQPPIDVHGRVTFTSEFFDPHAHFEAKVAGANGPVILELMFSHPATRWEIDALNLTWNPPPSPTPEPTKVVPLFAPAPAPASSTETPKPEATRKPRR